MSGSPSAAHAQPIPTEFPKLPSPDLFRYLLFSFAHYSHSRLFSTEVLHDVRRCMFSIQLNHQGQIASLLYLPTSHQEIIEFYHTEIPALYRYQGLGELLLYRAFQWAKENKKYVIPTCPFIRKYLSLNFDIHHHHHSTTACTLVSNTNTTNSNHHNNNLTCVNKKS